MRFWPVDELHEESPEEYPELYSEQKPVVKFIFMVIMLLCFDAIVYSLGDKLDFWNIFFGRDILAIILLLGLLTQYTNYKTEISRRQLERVRQEYHELAHANIENAQAEIRQRAQQQNIPKDLPPLSANSKRRLRTPDRS